MARAKRTNRAEARRRYRAAVEEPDLPGEQADDAEADATSRASAAPISRSSRPAPTTQGRTPRPSLAAAFRGAFRPVDLRGDLQALPAILRSKAVIAPVLLSIGAGAAYYLSPSEWTLILFNYFAYVPPIAAIFLAGFLAPRASYLTGLIAAVAGSIVFTVIALLSIGQTTADGRVIDAAGVSGDIGLAWTVSPISGVLFGASAGWYRRFLTAANPNRAARPPQRPNDRPRRKGSEPRPMLARRR